MSQQSKNTLQSAINTQIADNTSGNITAANVRNNLINITDSLLFNTGSQAITGSLTVTGGITGSLFGTAATASYVLGTTIKSYGSYALNGAPGPFTWPNTASYLGYAVPLLSINQSYYTIDLTIQAWVNQITPVVIKLYMSTNNTGNYPYTASVNDVLIGTFSASIGSTGSSNDFNYRLKRSFYLALDRIDDDNTTYYLNSANPTASILSDDSINEYYPNNVGTSNNNTVPYPYLKIVGQTNSISSYTYAFGPLRITY
jgi:hypothetical protein